MTGYVDVASERAYRYRRGEPSELITLPAAMADREKEAHAALLETLADHDDALLEKILEDVAPSSDEIYRQLHKDLAEGAVVPVLLGAAERDHGVRRLWKALRHDAPDPGETAERRGIAAGGRAARAGVQDGACRAHGQALLCAGVARDRSRTARRSTGTGSAASTAS